MALLTPEETVDLQNAGFRVHEFVDSHDGKPRVQIGGSWTDFPDEVDDHVRTLVNVGRLKWSYSGSDPTLRTKFLVYTSRVTSRDEKRPGTIAGA